MELGKLPPQVLEELVLRPIRYNEKKREDVVLRPKTGEDCSAVDPQGEYILLSTDPITGADADAGYLAVHVNCNDIFAGGGEPIGILLTVLLPQSAQMEVLHEIMDGAREAAAEVGIEILGGHTEVTDAVNRPLVSAAVIGKTSGKHLLSTGGAKEGQDVVMTKWAGLEGTAILANTYAAELSSLLPVQTAASAKEWKSYFSVGKEAKIALQHGATAMHDATEGGIFGAVWEMADCSGTGVVLFEEAIPVPPQTRQICDIFSISPYELISSGCLVVATEQGEALVKKLKEAGIAAAVIGKITKSGRTLLQNGVERPLEEPKKDALYRIKTDRLQK